MKKTLLILGIIAIVLTVAFLGLRRYTKSFSPEAKAAFSKNELDIKVKFSRPAKKGRFIFGREQDGALVPYGKVWRTGANEATVLEVGQSINFAGEAVAAGAYSLWSVPGQGGWQVILNSESGQWGTEYNDGKDLFKVNVPIRVRPQVQEMFDIYFEEQPEGVNMILSWDQTEAIIPITAQ
ncbi:Protein of unknown function (DUF2911) [Dyadobacter jejuensis]|uniref:DUF2911 family protein n=1 Tax=Dyadobacter jejuensis TaxID=1082580 RepID=A0A316AGV2_9BACT|nr:DUF2911 domain-containing protein [Dyadobacter jejuensis]PWJ56943.1 Protein of unknown function (DUF2911) [Dyadobacter jejuensis]